MKQKLIATLVGGALAGLAVTTANAGVIQASYKVYAAENFGGSATVLTVPTVAYNLALPLSGNSTNPNSFRISLTLSAGQYDLTAPHNLPTAVLRDPSSANALMADGVEFSNNNTTVTFHFTLNQDGASFPTNSTITIGDADTMGVGVGNAGAMDSVARVTPVTLSAKGVDGVLRTPLDNACNPTQAQVNATVKMTNAAGVEFDSDLTSASNTTAILASNVALNITGVSSSAFGAAAANNESSKVDVLITGLGKSFTDPSTSPSTQSVVDVTDGQVGTVVIGKVVMTDRSALYAANGNDTYSLFNGNLDQTSGLDGLVSANHISVRIGGHFVQKPGVLSFNRQADCKGSSAGTVTFNADGSATLDMLVGNGAPGNIWEILGGGARREAFICYTPGGADIIPTSQFSLMANSVGLTKAAASNEATNPVCPAQLYYLGANGVQLDVRNYIQAAQTDASNGWKSVLRIINTDEVQTATVSAQLIEDTGRLLAAGPIVTLAPRAVVYMDNEQIEAKLPETVAGSGNNARLRITAPNSSIRVQNYHLNPITGAVTEVSAAQGDEGPGLNLDPRGGADAMSK